MWKFFTAHLPKNITPTLFIKLIVLITISLSAVFYSGDITAFRWYAADPYAFVETKPISFTPQLLPINNSAFSPEVSAVSYVVMDASSFTPIIGKNIHSRMLPASTVKLMTALVSYEEYDLEDIVTVKKVIDEEVKMNLVSGEKISVLNLLYGTLINSANDGAYALAQHYPSGVKGFVQRMNEKAKSFHMNNTYFQNPIGFDDDSQYSTAYDLSILAREVVRRKFLLSITSTKSINVSDATFERYHSLTNINELIGEIPHLGGLKTGYTDAAGQNLISYYELNGKPLIIVILKSEDRFEDTRNIITYLQNNIRYEKID